VVGVLRPFRYIHMFDINRIDPRHIVIYEKLNSNLSGMVSPDGWIDMSCIWDDMVRAGSERDAQKSSYKSTKNWSRYSTHTLGVIGELCFSITTGRCANMDIIPEGDGNVDFVIDGKKIDIKTTQYWRDPDLKQYSNPKNWVDIYVLCGVDVDGRRARIFGWATMEQVMSAHVIDYGYGNQLSLNYSELNKDLSSFMSTIISSSH
jgi:hypothetical protein